jgi:secreted trypsin-like serine protease
MKRILLLMLALCTICTVQATNTPKHGVVKKKKIIITPNTTTISQAPYQVFLPLSSGPDYPKRGGGAILNSEWVLTAAHIAKDNPSVWQKVSKISTANPNDKKTLLAAFIHPDYNNSDSNPVSDIALLRLAQPLDLSGPNSKSIRLASMAD